MLNKLFINRLDAANKLYDMLPLDQMEKNQWIVIATSLNGIEVASALADKLKAQVDFMFTLKINAPKNDECEIAIITETEDIIIHEELMKSFDIKLEDIYKEAKDQYNTQMKDIINKYRNNKELISIKDKNILLVDEGLNTGLTMMACIKSAIGQGAKSVSVAVPVLPEVTIKDIETIADDIYFVQAPAGFVSIDFYYKDLPSVAFDQIKI